MCVCVRARARARGSQWFWPPKVIFGKCESCRESHRWRPLGDFTWILAKPVKFYRRAYMFWWNWFPGFEKNTSFELSRTNILCDETYETKNLQIQKNLGFLRNEWSSFDRLLQPERNHTWFRNHDDLLSKSNQTLNRLRISLAWSKVLFLATSASGTWF